MTELHRRPPSGALARAVRGLLTKTGLELKVRGQLTNKYSDNSGGLRRTQDIFPEFFKTRSGSSCPEPWPGDGILTS